MKTRVITQASLRGIAVDPAGGWASVGYTTDMKDFISVTTNDNCRAHADGSDALGCLACEDRRNPLRKITNEMKKMTTSMQSTTQAFGFVKDVMNKAYEAEKRAVRDQYINTYTSTFYMKDPKVVKITNFS